MTKVYYWPDGTWCLEEEYAPNEYNWKPEKYGILFIPGHPLDHEIGNLVFDRVS